MYLRNKLLPAIALLHTLLVLIKNFDVCIEMQKDAVINKIGLYPGELIAGIISLLANRSTYLQGGIKLMQ